MKSNTPYRENVHCMIQNEIFSMWHKYGEKLMDTQLDLLHRTTDQKITKKNRKQSPKKIRPSPSP